MISLRYFCIVRRILAVQNAQQSRGGMIEALTKKFSRSVVLAHKSLANSSATVSVKAENPVADASVSNEQQTPPEWSACGVDLDTHFSEDSIEKPPDVKKIRNPFHNIEEDYKNYDSSDVSHFIDDIAPVPPISFNLAAYVNKSPTLQKLVQLGVDLSKIEERPQQAKMLLMMDFEQDIKPYIQFLHDKGVLPEELGVILTKNPMLLKEDLENLQIRINYLLSKKFSNEAIARIISRNVYHLMIDTKKVDRRLGFLQQTFHLSGDEVRFVVAKYPRLVSYDYRKFMEKLVVFKEVMGFSAPEMKRFLIMKPKIWTLSRKNLEERFHIVHNIMGLPQEEILKFPGLLLKRQFLLEQRHKYLVHLNRAQYDSTKPGYVSLIDIATTTDHVFCRKCAKTSVEEYNEFLKTA